MLGVELNTEGGDLLKRMIQIVESDLRRLEDLKLFLLSKQSFDDDEIVLLSKIIIMALNSSAWILSGVWLPEDEGCIIVLISLNEF